MFEDKHLHRFRMASNRLHGVDHYVTACGGHQHDSTTALLHRHNSASATTCSFELRHPYCWAVGSAATQSISIPGSVLRRPGKGYSNERLRRPPVVASGLKVWLNYTKHHTRRQCKRRATGRWTRAVQVGGQ